MISTLAWFTLIVCSLGVLANLIMMFGHSNGDERVAALIRCAFQTPILVFAYLTLFGGS